MAGAIVDKGPSWIEALGELTPLVAIALLLVGVVVLFVYGQRRIQKSTLETIQLVSETIVRPLADSQKQSVGEFKEVVSNHLAHDMESRDAQTKAFVELVDCIKDKGGQK